MHYDRARPFGHSMLYPRSAHNLFRYPYNIFPNVVARNATDRLNPSRSGAATSQQEVGLTFEDLVPDNMWSGHDSGEPSRALTDYIFPSAFYRWAEETVVLDGESVHDLVLLFKAHIISHLIAGLKVDIAKRAALRDERKKKEKEKEEGKAKEKRKTEGVEVQVNLIVDENATEASQSDEGAASNGAPTPAAVTPGNLTPGTPANTPNNTTRNTPTHTNSNTPATSGPNTRPDSPVNPADQNAPNPDDQLQAVSEELQDQQLDCDEIIIIDGQGSQTSFEYFSAESEQDTGDAENSEQMEVAHPTPGSDEQMSVDNGTSEQDTFLSAIDGTSPETPEDPPVAEEPAAPEPIAEPTVEAPASAESATSAEPIINPWGDIDPTFLIALPEECRRDIYSQVFDTVRRQVPTSTSAADAIAPISAEFLTALPDNIQSEVTTAHNRAREEIEARRQRSEQQRVAAATTAAAAAAASATSSGLAGLAGAGTEGDPASFIANLDADLRRQILQELDDDTINRLPTELAAEARALQQEIHQRQMRFLNSRTARSSRRTFQGRPNFMSTRLIRSRDPRRLGIKRSAIPHLPVKNSLDSESLTCLLVIIFINDSNIQQPKLHRILKNVSNHRKTRHWLTSTLIDIIKRTSEVSLTSLTDPTLLEWLSLKLEASLGTRHCVFHLDSQASSIAIHSQDYG